VSDQQQPPSLPPVDFEQALEQLEEIVRDLEQGQLGLEASLARYEQGVVLLRRCHELLERAERRIALLSGVDAEGKPIATAMDDRSFTLEEKARSRSRRRTASEPGPPPQTGGDSVGNFKMDSPPEVT